jgi:hypothetical protein
MLPCLRRAGVLVAFLPSLLAAGCGLFNQASDEPPETAEGVPEYQSQGPQHEAFGSSLGAHSRHAVSVLYPPPAPLSELPPEPKPAGDDVVWASGYWIWDTSRDDWKWVHGVWGHAPPGRRWMPGYWSMAADGWCWKPGFWAIDPPPPPAAPPSYSPPPTLAYAPVATCFDDPGFAFFTGYGMWWPWYRTRPFHAERREGPPTPLLPSGHLAVPAVATQGPHAAEFLPSLVPPLASSIHAPAPASPSTQPHLDMASILASVPKPMAGSLNPPRSFELHNDHPLFALHPAVNGRGESGAAAVLHDPTGRIHSLFVNQHLETALHEHLPFHGNSAARPMSVERGGERGPASNSHVSGGHGGGHGR